MAAVELDDRAQTPPREEFGVPLGSEGPEGEQVAMPLPSDFSDIFQGGLFVLALLAALYVAREIVLPIGHLEKWRLPPICASLIFDSRICGLGDDGTVQLF
jgi:hypothetical protein